VPRAHFGPCADRGALQGASSPGNVRSSDLPSGYLSTLGAPAFKYFTSAQPRTSVVTRQAAQGRETSGAIDFDAAQEPYLDGRGHEALLRAAGKVIDGDMPFAPEHADTISS
jgi:hypothetical protein